MILTIAFTIIPFELASDICIDVPFAVMVSVLIHFGRKPGLWAAAGTFLAILAAAGD